MKGFSNHLRHLLLTATLTFAAIVQAQVPDLDWALSSGSQPMDVGRAIAEDAQGNVVAVGFFNDSIDLDGGPGQMLLSSNGGTDCFVAKYNRQGQAIWAKAIGGTGNQDGRAVSTDPQGNIYVCGRMTGPTDLDPGPNIFADTSGSMGDAFVVKLDPNGDFVWGATYGDLGMDDAFGIAADSAGVVISGIYQGQVDFDPSASSFQLNSISGTLDVFIAKYSLGGSLIWAKSVGGPWQDYGFGVSLDPNGNPLVAGCLQDSADLDPSPSGHWLHGHAANSAFLLKLDANGNFVWANNLGNANCSGIANAVCSSSEGMVYVTGNFRGSHDFDNGTGNTTLSSDPGSNDFFMAKYLPDGSLAWAKHFGGIGDDVGYALSTFGDRVYAAGQFGATVDFDPGQDTFALTSYNFSFDAFVYALDTNGLFQWVEPLGGAGVDYGFGIKASPTKRIFSIGCYEQSMDLDPGLDSLNVSSNGAADIFIQSLKQCLPSFQSLTLGACDEVEVNGIAYDSSGTYVQMLENIYGCDSTLQISVTIEALDTSVTNLMTELVANQTGVSYQWLDCNQGMSPIAGANSNNYISPTSFGIYAVQVSGFFCTDTSGCHTILWEAIQPANPFGISIAPNPSQGRFVLSMENWTAACPFEVIDLQGRMLFSGILDSKSMELNLQVSPGIYFLRVKSEEKQSNTPIFIAQ